jgi:hypothetical protein
MKVELDVNGFTNGKVPTSEAWSVALYAAGLLTGTSQVRVIPSPGDGYRWLAPGEIKKQGDEVTKDNGISWSKTCEAGRTVVQEQVYEYRRKTEASHPGSGYRWITKGETKQSGDQYFSSSGEWMPTREPGVAAAFDGYWRRPISSPDASPGEGWRWVEPGEKTIDGDEKTNSGPVSEPGEPVTERLVFRRKIANVKDLEFDVFLLRRQLAACKRAAQANTRDSAEHVKRDITGMYATEAFQAVCHAVQREMNHREARSPLTPDQAKVVSTAAVGMRTAAAVTKSELSREILNRQADVLESIEFGGLADEDRRAVSFALKAIRGQATAALNLSEICNRLEKLAGGGSSAST